MEKLLSRKFWLLAITYLLFTFLFIFGKIPVNWFCLSILAMSAFYFIANVWQKQLSGMSVDQIIEILERLRK